MSADVLIALAIFCVVATITPGPNNMMLLSSGATFGFRRTLPHIFGISAGCFVMRIMLGFGLAGVIASLPWLFPLLEVVTAIYLAYLAWRIATSVGVGAASPRAKPLSFMDAAAFQWVNPKAWAISLGAMTGFSRPDHLLSDMIVSAAMLILCGLPCIMLWAGGGTMVRHLLTRPAMLRLFNVGMAALLVLSLVPGLVDVARL